jgi:cold shock CspA family protein
MFANGEGASKTALAIMNDNAATNAQRPSLKRAASAAHQITRISKVGHSQIQKRGRARRGTNFPFKWPFCGMLAASRRRRLLWPRTLVLAFYVERAMPSGRIKFYDADRGFGFIESDDGAKDVFVHITSCARDMEEMKEGQRVWFAVRISLRSGIPEAFEVEVNGG